MRRMLVGVMLASVWVQGCGRVGPEQTAPPENTPAAATEQVVPQDASSAPEAAAAVSGSTTTEDAVQSVGRGLAWLAAQQKPDGSWSNKDFPALTALPVWAMAVDGGAAWKDVIAKGAAYLVSCVQTNGGIYREVDGRKGGGLSNYNTAICMTALHATGDPAFVPIVQKARRFLADSQHLGGDVYRGGFGYDRQTQRAYTDLLNTYYTVQAMQLTQSVEDLRPAGEARADIDWDETRAFIEKMQNKTAAGEDDAGGFVYNPTDPKAGTRTNQQGVVFFRSYGSITYAGLLSLIYAKVPRDDARVLSALDWTAKHWSLEQNPGMGAQGLYFFYNVLTKALSAYGQDLIPMPDNTLLNWREEVAKKLISLQKIDPNTGAGYWVNENGRFWESDPVLATSYCILALETLQ